MWVEFANSIFVDKFCHVCSIFRKPIYAFNFYCYYHTVKDNVSSLNLIMFILTWDFFTET